MQLSLRSIADVQTEIEDRIVDGISTSTLVSIYEPNLETAVVDERNFQLAMMAVTDRLESISLALRKTVGRQKAAIGITDLTAEQTMLESRRDRLESLVDHKPTSLAHNRARLTVAREQGGYREYGFGDRVGHISVDVLTPDDIEAVQKSVIVVKRRLRELTETLAVLNLQTTIEIPLEDMEFLRRQGIV
jgi:hypothetical protein